MKLSRINIIGSLLCLLISIGVNAQKESLTELCKGINSLVNSEGGLHIEYDMIMMGRGVEYTNPDSIKISYFKNGTKGFHIKQGEFQEILRDGNKVVMISHEEKQVMYQVDTNDITNSNDLFNQISDLVELSSNIDLLVKGDSLIYNLSLKSNHMYDKVTFKFSKKSKKILSMYAVFKKDYHEPYKYLKVIYTYWNQNWEPTKGFPNLKKYIVKSNGKLIAGKLISGYSVFAPQTQNINIDLSK